MLDKETFEKLQAKVLERLTQTLPNKSKMDEYIQSMFKLAVLTSIITLEEYEKLNQ